MGHDRGDLNIESLQSIDNQPTPPPEVPKPSELSSNDDAVASAVIDYCHDGDTCRVRFGDAVWLNVRLAGIDAPELRKGGRGGHWDAQPGGEAAKEALNRLIQGKEVDLRQIDLDQYNRPVVEIRIQDHLVNLQMVTDGMAEVYRGKVKRLDQAPYFAAEANARASKKGIWALAHYESPGSYRHRHQ